MKLTRTKFRTILILNIEGTPKEIKDFECSLFNWGAINEEAFEKIDEFHASIKIKEKQLLRYFTDIEENRFDPDRLKTEFLKKFVDNRVEKRFNEIVEIERPSLCQMR